LSNRGLTPTELTDAERRLRQLLRGCTWLFFALTLALIVVGEVGSIGSVLREPPWLGGTVGTGALLVMLCAYAAGEPRRRPGLVGALVLTLAVAAFAQLAYLIGDKGPGSDLVLIVLLAFELLVAVAVLVLARAARAAGLDAAPSAHWPSDADAGLRIVLILVGAGFALVTVAAVVGPFVDSLHELFEQPLLTAQGAAGGAGVAALAFYIAADIRDRLALVGVLAVAFFVVALADLALVLRHAHLDGQLDVLGPTEYRALMALSDVIVQGPDEAVPPPTIAANVDRYFDRIRAKRRWVQRVGLMAMQLHPLLALKAPFSELDEEARLDHLKRHFQRAGERRGLPGRQFVQAMIRVANQLTYVGYYSDPDSHATVGYEPFEQRSRFAQLEREGKIPTPGEHPLRVSRPEAVADTDIQADVCIVGSGAGGAVLAYRLAEAGKSVVMLERGQYVEPKDFSSDEVEMIGKLYGDGVFQQTEDFRFTVLQGSCVGGSTVVNNAVSIPPPAHVLARWNGRYGAGLDLTGLTQSTARIEQLLRMGPMDPGPVNPDVRLNPSAPKFLDGVAKQQQDPDFELAVQTAHANINGCLGCGYCNIGCRYGKKLSMLDSLLPWAQREFGVQQVRIFAECEVEKIISDGGSPKRATAVRAKLSDGRKLTVRADKIVVAAGTVASSYLLRRSGIGKALPVGRHVSFNMGAPLTAEFDDDLDAYDGLQISHVAMPSPERGWVFETWWNPPVSQALNMPGWFETHYENMRRYRRLMAVGALVGTERNAYIGRALTGGPAIHYTPTGGDMRKLADGLMELGQILFAGGAKAIMVNAWDFYRFTSPNGLSELPSIMSDPSMVALGTGHPQGGNAIGSNPADSVVTPDFNVHGYSNLYVCDASVFPSSLTVNPQLTVMSLADYAAPRIAA
jgi:choline dehydrogenase-like flavoprotein